MICGRPRTALCAAGILFVSFDPASAQQSSVSMGRDSAVVSSTGQSKPVPTAQTPTGKPRELPSGKPPTSTIPPGQQPRPSEDRRNAAQGFSVVLVLADLTATNAQDDVPPAARRALADMKDFLPYKSYKLLDAAWLLGQGQQTIRLRGPEEQDYELRLVTPGWASGSGRLSVQFQLREAQGQEAAAAEEALHAKMSEAGEMDRLSVALREAREKRDQAKVRELEKELATMRDARTRTAVRSRKALASNRPIIDTSFTMDVGETVVVGTSRLKENDGALIALLTAVPPRPPRGASPQGEVR